jgi:bleomycin hydrolase
MKFINLIFIAILILNIGSQSYAQKKLAEYKFEKVAEVKTTSVKNQGSSGTCWSFAATSFLETEILRKTNKEIDLSEMFFVYHAYQQKAESYVRFQGKTNFSPGGQAHDVLYVMDEYGLTTEKAYPGLSKDQKIHNHGELNEVLTAYLDALIKNKNGKLTATWQDAFAALLNVYMQNPPEKFEFENQQISPKELLEKSELNSDDYVEITSFTHLPYYEESLLKIPDNWTYSDYYNVPLEDLMEIINYSIENGYSVCWDGDVSSRGFSHANGLAIIPETEVENLQGTELSKWENIEDYKAEAYSFKKIVPEKNITEEYRQKLFDNYTTTDDHLMHLTAIYKDQNGTLYYQTKNSWSDKTNDFGGYLKMSEAFLRLNTVAIMVHKDAIPKEIREKLGLD